MDYNILTTYLFNFHFNTLFLYENALGPLAKFFNSQTQTGMWEQQNLNPVFLSFSSDRSKNSQHSRFTAIKEHKYCVILSQLPFKQHWNILFLVQELVAYAWMNKKSCSGLNFPKYPLANVLAGINSNLGMWHPTVFYNMKPRILF